MAYEVTASRRRPQKFENLVGQDFVSVTLKNAVKSGKIAHAYLFSGPRGCGKTSAARILAKMLNCELGTEMSPCGKCSPCTEITRGASMDVIEIDGASNTSVNDVRQIKDEVLFPPNSSKYKIYIIDEVHMLSTSAFNALLKTIEEPPPYVIFIFATTELHKVPATIKSRCQQFHFRLGSVEQIKNLLSQALAEDGIQADDEALYWIARESTGSFRDAYTLLDQVSAFSAGRITYEKIRDKLGLVGVQQLNELCELCVNGSADQAINFIDTLLQSGVSIEQCILNITDYMRSLLFIKSGINKESLLGQGIQRFSERVLSAWSKLQLERALSLFLQLYRDVRYSLNPRYELELAVSRLTWLSSWVSAAEVKNAVDAAKSVLTGDGQRQAQNAAENLQYAQNPQSARQSFPLKRSGIQTEPAQEPAKQEKTESPNLQSSREPIASLDELRRKIIAEMEQIKTLAASTLSQTGIWRCDGINLHIPIHNAFMQKQLEAECPLISSLIQKHWNKSVHVSIELLSLPEAEAIVIPPEVQVVCDTFRGTLTSIEPAAGDKYEH